MGIGHLKACQIISDMQDKLIQIEIALSNKTMSSDNAYKHIKQILVLVNSIEVELKSENLTTEIKDIAKSLIEKTRISYNTNNYACK